MLPWPLLEIWDRDIGPSAGRTSGLEAAVGDVGVGGLREQYVGEGERGDAGRGKQAVP
jgi:hypothetical protein